MKVEEKVARLQQLIDSAPASRGTVFAQWRNDAATLLRYFLGDDNEFTKRFQNLKFSASARSSSTGMNQLRSDQAFASGVEGGKNLLIAAIRELQLIEELEVVGVKPVSRQSAHGNQIFVVHGHNKALRLEVVDFLTKATGHPPKVLVDEANLGRELFQKFEDVADESSFAVVLATADDIGRAMSATDERSRARQNVILEWGFFAGRLGRDRVALLCEPGIELPSDIGGLVYIALDPAGAWRLSLAKELKAAKIDLSLDRVL